MRKIKFRAWDKEDKKMYKVIGFSEAIYGDCEQKHILMCNFDENPKDKDTNIRISLEYEVMQFTGLKDKNKNEIWEGDIERDIKGNISVVVYLDEYGVFAFVPWFEYLGIENINDNCTHYIHEAMPHIYSEIIGNVYEHPHLLKVSEGK